MKLTCYLQTFFLENLELFSEKIMTENFIFMKKSQNNHI